MRERVHDHRRALTARVRHLVDAGERGEHEVGPVARARGASTCAADVAIDLQPAGDVAAEVRARGAERGQRR